jgi:hypothetical protein
MERKGSSDSFYHKFETSIADQTITSLSSKECYCLIYSRQDMQPVEVQAPSEQVTGRVKELNEEIKNDCDRYNQR